MSEPQPNQTERQLHYFMPDAETGLCIACGKMKLWQYHIEPDEPQSKQPCRRCLQVVTHDIRCRLAKGLDTPVLDSEREVADIERAEPQGEAGETNENLCCE